MNIETQRRGLRDAWQFQNPGQTPVIHTTINGKDIAIKDEEQNFSNTYKAKHGWRMGPHYLRHGFPNDYTYFSVSTGNAAMADFIYADMLNKLLGEQKVHVINFWPKHYDTKLLGPDSFGKFTSGGRFRQAMEQHLSGRNEVVDFNEAFWDTNACRQHLNKQGLNLTPENSMDITEGFNPTYTQVPSELVHQLIRKHQVGKCTRAEPRILLVVQYGAGMLYNDCATFFQEHTYPVDVIAVSTRNPQTIADKIYDMSGRWQEQQEIATDGGTHTYSKKGKHKIELVTDQEILLALQRMKTLSISAEPSGAAGLAILPRLEELIGTEHYRSYDILAFINTGNGIRSSAYNSDGLY